MDYEACIQKISKIRARTDDRHEFLIDTVLHRRWKEQNAAFVWSKENVQKLLAMNATLMELGSKGLEALERVYWDLKRMIDSGKKDHRIGFCLSDGSHSLVDKKEMSFDMNRNITGAFRDRPEFAGQHISYLMYKFFGGNYSFQDALKMDPDDFCYSIKISL